MRRMPLRLLSMLAAAGLLLAGCSDDPDQAATDQTDAQSSEDDGGPEDPTEGDQGTEDPTDNIDDGVYRGNGVALPVPDGWSIDPTALAQGAVVAVAEDGMRQFTAQAIAAETLEARGQDADFDALVASIRERIPQEAEIDEAIDLTGAARAHRLTYLDLPAQQEGQPATSATVVVAEDGQGLIGEFSFGATTAAYDEELAQTLLTEGGFDPDSEPPTMPQQPPAPES